MCIINAPYTWFIQEITERFKDDGYSTDRLPVSPHVPVTSDGDNVDIPHQIVTQGWNVKRQQVILYLIYCFMLFEHTYSTCNVIFTWYSGQETNRGYHC